MKKLCTPPHDLRLFSLPENIESQFRRPTNMHECLPKKHKSKKKKRGGQPLPCSQPCGRIPRSAQMPPRVCHNRSLAAPPVTSTGKLDSPRRIRVVPRSRCHLLPEIISMESRIDANAISHPGAKKERATPWRAPHIHMRCVVRRAGGSHLVVWQSVPCQRACGSLEATGVTHAQSFMTARERSGFDE